MPIKDRFLIPLPDNSSIDKDFIINIPNEDEEAVIMQGTA